MIKVAVLGYGTVGRGVVSALENNMEKLSSVLDKKITVKYIFARRDYPGDSNNHLVVRDINKILEDEEVKIVIETLGGTEPAYEYVRESLLRGKSVVTSNKELVAKHGAELLKIARDKKLNFLFEASVGGGIPIIRPLFHSLQAEEILEISGILNGTTNFILTEMKKNNLSFQEALKLAQEKGYAERIPDADVLGFDAARKIAILTSLYLRKQVDAQDVNTKGITEISYTDMEYTDALNSEIKLIAKSEKIGDSVSIRVSPMMLSRENPLSHVNDVFNAVLVKGNIVGPVMFYGRGAGRYPTAAAVVSDIVDCAQNMDKNIGYYWDSEVYKKTNTAETEDKYFIRLKIDAKEKFTEYKLCQLSNHAEEFAIITEKLTAQKFSDFIEKNKDTVISYILLGD